MFNWFNDLVQMKMMEMNNGRPYTVSRQKKH